MRIENAPAPGAGSAAAPVFLVASAVFLLVGAARVALLQAYGSPLPLWDQWDSEAAGLYPAFIDGSESRLALFAPHNEHRIAFTRLANLALFALGDGWRPWAQLGFNALLHAATAALLVFALPPMRTGLRVAGVGLVTAAYILPAGWQNALWGFQSQVLFGHLFAVGACLLALGPPTPTRVAGTAGLATAALFTTAGGWLVAVGLIAALLIRTAAQRTVCRPTALLLLALGAVVALGWVLRVDVPGHAALRAQTLGQFLAVAGRGLAWPWVDQPLAALVLQAPVLVLLFRIWRLRDHGHSLPWVLLSLVAYSALQAAAVAFARGAGLPEFRPLSRYHDGLLPGVVAQGLAVLLLASQSRWGRGLALGWFAVFALGTVPLTTRVLTESLPYKRQQDTAGLAGVRAYLQHGDPALFTSEAARHVHPDPATLRRHLDAPAVRRVLPAELIAPEPMPPPRWLGAAPWLALAGAICLGWALQRERRAER